MKLYDGPESKAFYMAFEALEAAAQDFVDKVERGEARSRRSYAKFKDALALAKKVKS